MDFNIETLPFLALYAETHFKFFRFFPSFLYQKQPEIIFDSPKRISPDKDIPVMLICNDIDQYPIDIINVRISISQSGSSKVVLDETDISRYRIDHPYNNQSHVYLFFLSYYLFDPGCYSINGIITYKDKASGRERIVINDNLRTSSKNALTGFIAEDQYPGSDWCIFGDLHVHSQYSRSHVEFGPPVKVLDIIAATSGLSFIGITDHSYDLACTMENYLKSDPDFKQWESIRSDIHANRKSYRTTVILGEEISTCNTKNRVIHLGALGINEYIPGSKDGARKQTESTTTEPNIAEATQNINKQGGVSFAAHPGARSRIMQRIFLKRGTWRSEDIHPDLHAYQAANNGFTNSWYRARKLWIQTLLQKRKLPLIAGNDSHGDFNRYRSLGIPFMTVSENFYRYLSYVRTGIYSRDKKEESILSAIKSGRTFITNGPFLTISSTESADDCIISHHDFSLEKNCVFVIGTSTYEFGTPRILRIFRGCYQTKQENLLKLISYDKQQFRVTDKITLDAENGAGYIRASLICITDDGSQTMAVTSPVYIK